MHPVTYCTNIHPGETWDEMLHSLAAHTLAVKAAVCPDEPFPVGLRVSGAAAREATPGKAQRLKDWLGANGLYVRTLNGFPYGRFHSAPVKSTVYQPDWRNPERLAYTKRLADLLAVLLPEGATGAISTVPLGFRADFPQADIGPALLLLRQALEHLSTLAQGTGRHIRLCLEPEPGCLLETTADAVDFFARMNPPAHLTPHLALCYDCCHQALQFEDAKRSLSMLALNEVPVGMVQVSSALHLEGGALYRLSRYDEPVYLHQVVGRKTDASLVRHPDLPQALAAKDADVEAWRVHFHLPVFLPSLPECASTQDFLVDALPLFAPDTPLEVETYTFDVLPSDLRAATVTESIAREIRWVERHRLQSGPASQLPGTGRWNWTSRG